MSLDFALKDFFRKKKQTYPYVFIIALVIGLAEFVIYYTSSLGLELMIQNLTQDALQNEYFFSGIINQIYSRFNTFIVTLIVILAIVVVLVITTSLIITKKRDISIMKAIGSLPRALYGFYLTEAYIIFFLGFLLGIVGGLIAFGIFTLIMFFIGFQIILSIELFYSSILFLGCFFGIFIVPGYSLRKLGSKNIIKSFSQDIPHDYDASQQTKRIQRLFISIGFHFKMAYINTIRRKGEFKRYFFIFLMIFLIIFSLGLGSIVLNNSTQTWIEKSQGEGIIVIGHEDAVDTYSQMYAMFSDPEISVSKDDIDFLDEKYLFNSSQLGNIEDIEGIQRVDKRLINFFDCEEIDGIVFREDEEGGGSGGYYEVGEGRTGNYPIIGIDPENLVQNFEIDGEKFTNDDSYDNMSVGDGLAYGFFEYAPEQSLRITDIQRRFHVKGIFIDSFFNGYAGYMGLDILQKELNFTQHQINLMLLKVDPNNFDEINGVLGELIADNLGDEFDFKQLDEIFEQNLNYLSLLSIYPMILIILLSAVAIICLYNYQKAGLMEKAKDFLIMRAIGAKNKSIKRILFIELVFIIIPTLLLSMSLGMMFNSLILLERAALPSLLVPFGLMFAIFGAALLVSYLSLNPIMRKIEEFSVKDFEIY